MDSQGWTGGVWKAQREIVDHECQVFSEKLTCLLDYGRSIKTISDVLKTKKQSDNRTHVRKLNGIAEKFSDGGLLYTVATFLAEQLQKRSDSKYTSFSVATAGSAAGYADEMSNTFGIETPKNASCRLTPIRRMPPSTTIVSWRMRVIFSILRACSTLVSRKPRTI